MMIRMAIAAAFLSATGAQAQQGVVLPAQGALHLWDMTAEPPRQLTGALPDTATAGGCFALSGNKLTPQGVSCLGYYVAGRAGDNGPMRATGRLAFNDVTPDLAYRGLQLSDASGVEDCGERESCETIYIAGFANAELAAKAMQLARDGARVTLTGQGVWNLESVDMIVEGIR